MPSTFKQPIMSIKQQSKEIPYSANDEYFQTRKAAFEKREKDTGIVTYPHKYHTNTTVNKFIEKYHGLESGGRIDEVEVSVAGRIVSWRAQGKKLVFFRLRNDGYDVQIWMTRDMYEGDMDDILKHVKCYDIVGVRGIPARTKRNELSIITREVTLLSPCLRMVPDKLTDSEIRFRKRHLDGIVNHDSVRKIFAMRCAVITYIRNFFLNRGFMEVETSMLQAVVGGAAARPFLTELNATKQTVGLRISPELELKELVVSGFEKVFEIGRQFRNEGMDITHNPAFTSIESYEAYTDFYDLTEMSEELLSKLVMKVKGSYKCMVKPLEGDGTGDLIEVDFTPPFRRVPMIETLENKLGVKFPLPLDSDKCNKFLINLCGKKDIKLTPPYTTARILDTLTGEIIEPTCINPTFIIEHPQLMSPLAKYHRSKEGLTERGELFVCKKEIMNYYTELNNPHKQRECFSDQLKDREKGDDEANATDYNFIDSLDHALPPTGGWGMGIDRLVMLLTGQYSIREVLAFPMMKPLPT